MGYKALLIDALIPHRTVMYCKRLHVETRQWLDTSGSDRWMAQLLQQAPSEFCRVFLNSSPDLPELCFSGGVCSLWLAREIMSLEKKMIKKMAKIHVISRSILFFYFISTSKYRVSTFCRVH